MVRHPAPGLCPRKWLLSAAFFQIAVKPACRRCSPPAGRSPRPMPAEPVSGRRISLAPQSARRIAPPQPTDCSLTDAPAPGQAARRRQRARPYGVIAAAARARVARTTVTRRTTPALWRAFLCSACAQAPRLAATLLNGTPCSGRAGCGPAGSDAPRPGPSCRGREGTSSEADSRSVAHSESPAPARAATLILGPP